VVPNCNTGKIPVRAQFAPPQGAHIVNMQAFAYTQGHLLTLIPEKKPMNLSTDSQMPMEMTDTRNVTRPSTSG
jgi:hypothetical protein